jgi:hypothetical protein
MFGNAKQERQPTGAAKVGRYRAISAVLRTHIDSGALQMKIISQRRERPRIDLTYSLEEVLTEE